MEIRVGDWKATYHQGIAGHPYWEIRTVRSFALLRISVASKRMLAIPLPPTPTTYLEVRVAPVVNEMLSTAVRIDEDFITALLVALSLI